ncbi:MAG TPA: RHS repeat-associated core domain-containing protein [Longimicrobiaceae bacterium]|nr:RHS repeat-associated core domain-containing protein [Longimicrobiaceae bacterium]
MTPPYISITPGTSTRTSADLEVRTEVCENDLLDLGTFQVQLNGHDVSFRFAIGRGTKAGCQDYAASVGSITLNLGTNSFWTRICDRAENCAERTEVYTYDPDADVSPPTIEIQPPGGTYTSSHLPVTISWRDDKGLDGSRRSVKLNGIDVTGSFTYSGSATAGLSEDTVILAVGRNTLTASICDLAGKCTTVQAVYTSDTSPPKATFTPAGGTYPDSTLAVRIDWADDQGLNGDGRTIHLNGQDLTESFSYTAGETSGSAESADTVNLAPGSNELAARICDLAGNCSTSTVTYLRYLGDRVAPVVSALPHNESWTAASAFEAGASYGTAAYVTLDVPRSATLLYAGSQASPMAFVQVDAVDYSATPPEMVSISIRDAAGRPVWLDNGTQENFYVGGNGTMRLAAHWDAGALTTGAHTYTVVVRSWWGRQSLETRHSVRVLVVNERRSPFGAGWSLAGVQRLHPQGEGVVVTGGDGSAAYFAVASCDTDPHGQQRCTYTSPAGDFSTLRYEGGQYTRTYLDGSYLHFSAGGLLSSASDRLGNRTALFWTTSGLLESVQDPAGRSITFGYDGKGRLSRIQDPTGRATLFQVDAAGDLVRITEPDGIAALRAHYDARHRMRAQWDRNGSGWSYTYDAAGKLATLTPPQITAEGQQVRPETRFRSPEAVMLPEPGKGAFLNPARRLLPNDVWARIMEPRGDSATFVLDRWGAVARYRDREGRIGTVLRNELGQDTLAVTPKGDTTSYTWSGPNLVKVHGRNTGYTVNYDYDLRFNQVHYAWGSVPATRIFYNSRGLVDSTLVWGSGRAKTSYTYDARGRVRTLTDPEENRSEFFYDGNAWMNTDSVRSAVGRTAFTYDSFGRLATTRDPLDHVSAVRYDVLNRVRASVNALMDSTSFTYDPLFLTAVRDARGQTYGFEQNVLGWDTAQVDPRGSREHTTYDVSGNVRTYTNRRGQTVEFSYDAFNRLEERRADGKRTRYTYDPAGFFVVVSNEESIDTVRTDTIGRVTHEIAVRSGKKYTVRTSYDSRGRRGGVLLFVPGEEYATFRSVDYVYDDVNRLDRISASGSETRIGYNANRQPIQFRLPTGDTVDVSYPATGTVGSIRYRDVALNQAAGVLYRHDPLRRVLERRSAVGDTVREYRYDPVGRLKGHVDLLDHPESCVWDPSYAELCTGGTQDTLRTRTYAYDAVGNRIDGAGAVEPGNRLRYVRGDSLEYDADGNVTRKYRPGFEQRFFWSSLGQLDSVRTTRSGVAETVRFGYDGLGRRVRKSTDAGTAGYVYDGQQAVLELDGAGAVRAWYAFYPGVDRPYLMERGGARYYYLTEVPGHVAGLIDSTGVLVNQYRYSPFGEAEVVREQVQNPLRFTAREYDAETGLYYYRARYYDPALARFISEDPIRLEGGINPYAYAANDPVNRTDPSGLTPECYYLVTTWRVTTRRGGRIIDQYTYQTREFLYCDPRPAEQGLDSERDRLQGQAQQQEQPLGVCSASSIINNPFVRAAGSDAYARAVRSGRVWHERREQGNWLIPTPKGGYKIAPSAPGLTDVRMAPGEPPGGATWLVHSHLYRRAPGVPGQSLSVNDTAWARATNKGIMAFGPDSISWALPGGPIYNCPR